MVSGTAPSATTSVLDLIGNTPLVRVRHVDTGNPAGFATKVGKFTRQKFETIDVRSPTTDLIQVFERCRAVCVMDE
jgi:hypothetical protein